MKIIVLLALGACLSVPAGAEIIIRAYKHDYPATFQREERWKGMDIEILRETMKRAGMDFRIEHIPFKRGLLGMKEGAIHIVPNLVKNEERSQYMHWLGPTRVTCIGLVVQIKDKDLEITSTDALLELAMQRGQKVGYLAGASYSKRFDQRMLNDSNLTSVLHLLPSNEQHREMLKRGRILGYFYDKFEVRQRMLDPEFSARFEGLALNRFYRIEASCNGAYIGISKKLDADLTDRIVSAYRSMEEDGFFNRIHEKCTGELPDFL